MPTELIPQIIYGAVLLFVLGSVGALWHRMGSIQRDLGRLEANVSGTQVSLNEKTASLNEKIDATQASLNEKIDGVQASLNELTKTVAEMQLQMQRNHYQMMMAILSHSHRPDGRPTFDLPPDFEPTPSDAND